MDHIETFWNQYFIEHDAQPPVRISRVEDLLVYVWPVGGYLLEPSKVKSELQKFRAKLTEYGLCYVENKFYIAFYDFIVRFHGRQNELWLVVQHCPKVLNSSDTYTKTHGCPSLLCAVAKFLCFVAVL
jgi:hypothetical protein